jgi:hypothetical protein
VSQATAFAETYTRQSDGSWRLREAAGLDAVISIAPIGVEIPLAEVYEKVEFGDSEAEKISVSR